MPLFQFGNKKIKQLESELKRLSGYIATVNTGIKFINDSIAIYPSFDLSTQIKQYITSDQLYSIINKIAETTSLIPSYVYYEVADKKKIRSYQALTNRQLYNTKALFDIQVMQRKALEDAPEDDAMQVLLDSLDYIALYSFYLVHGEVFIYKMRLTEGANAGKPTQLHIWAPKNVVLSVTRDYPYSVVAYNLIIRGQTVIQAPAEDVIHIKNFNPIVNYNGGDDLRGYSPVLVANKVLTALNEADDAAVAQLQNGGVPGIVFNEEIGSEEINQENLDNVRKAYYDFVSDSANKGAAYFSAGKLGYISTGLKLADLEVATLQKIDFKRLCNIYKISSSLFNDPDSQRYNNLDTETKQLYTSACLPLAYKFVRALNNQLVPDFTDKPRFIDLDISVITELQDDVAKMAQMFASLPGGFTFNEIRQIFKWDANPDPIMDKPIAKQGYVFVEDMVPDPLAGIDPALVNGLYGNNTGLSDPNTGPVNDGNQNLNQ